MSAPTTTFTRTEAKASDAKLVELQEIASKAAARTDRTIVILHHTAGDRQQGWGRDRAWTLSNQEAYDKAVALAVEQAGNYIGTEAEQAVEAYHVAIEAQEAAFAAVTVQSREWRENGQWSRFLVVPGGHIHNNEGCFTLRADTRTGWLPELSGDAEADAVEAYGEVLCSHCYSSAPVAWQGGKTVVDASGKVLTKAEQAAIKEAKDAEKAAKLAAKAANEVLDIHTGRVLYKTERGATNAVASELDSALHYGPTHPMYSEWIDLLDQVSAALGAKQGRPAAEVRAELVAKAEKKAKKSLA